VGPAGTKRGWIHYRMWVSSQGIAEPLVVFEGERQAQRAGRCAGAARRPSSVGGETVDQRAHGKRIHRGSVAAGVQRHTHGGGAAGEQQARGGTGMSMRAHARTLEGAGKGNHAGGERPWLSLSWMRLGGDSGKGPGAPARCFEHGLEHARKHTQEDLRRIGLMGATQKKARGGNSRGGAATHGAGVADYCPVHKLHLTG
jgi:hypothetical protein